MPYAAVPARLIVVVAERTRDTARWGKCRKAPDDALGSAHRASREGPRRKPGVLKPVTRVRRGWAGTCEFCGRKIPWEGRAFVGGSSGIDRIYDTPSGKPEPGSLYWVEHYGDGCYVGWTNCAGPHLYGILPNGHGWDIDSRANNCGSPDDTTHRCWIRHGEPPALTVDKAGVTCSAGAGSIMAGDYHGFLQAGVFTAG